jgi:hypothetical protein
MCIDLNTFEQIDAEFTAMMSRLKFGMDTNDRPEQNPKQKIGQYRSELKENISHWNKLSNRAVDKEYADGYTDGIKRCLRAFDDIFYPQQPEQPKNSDGVAANSVLIA